MKANILLCLSSLLFLGSLALGVNKASELGIIESDWKLEDPKKDKAPISALEFETRETKIKELKEKQKQNEEAIEEEKLRISVKRKELVKCMKQKGVILFSIEDCEGCKTQKAYFGEDFKDVEYIDCKKNKITCPLRGIKEYPTWYLGSTLGIKKTGVKDLASLGKLTGCGF
jgi:hypothetical protein